MVFDETIYPFSNSTQPREQSSSPSVTLPAISSASCSVLHPLPPLATFQSPSLATLPVTPPVHLTPLSSPSTNTNPMDSPPQVRDSTTLSSSSPSLNSEPTTLQENGPEPEAQSKSPFIGPLPDPTLNTNSSSSMNPKPIHITTTTSTSQIKPPLLPPFNYYQNQHKTSTK